ncbi:MAG TPA: HIT domain-containing protein [Candidatus Dormibacteraeota bacterium]|jgi:ATP adenylyltransferase
MRQLWAPWRVEFIKGEKPPGCFFCEAAEAGPQRDAELHVLARTEWSLAIMNRYPYNNGHLMVAPRAHLATLEQLPPESAIDLTQVTQRSLRALRAVLKPDGFNLGINQGKVAGAGVADHVHQHVVPRWDGDTNFMPVIAEVKVMNEHLDASYRAIREGFDRLT